MMSTERECYVCCDATPPLLENICLCKTLLVHPECLDRMLAYAMQRDGRMRDRCTICQGRYFGLDDPAALPATLPAAPPSMALWIEEETSSTTSSSPDSPTSSSAGADAARVPSSSTSDRVGPSPVAPAARSAPPASGPLPVTLVRPRRHESPSGPPNQCFTGCMLICAGFVFLSASVRHLAAEPSHRGPTSVVVLVLGCGMLVSGGAACAVGMSGAMRASRPDSYVMGEV